MDSHSTKMNILETLKKYTVINKYEIYSYRLMDNHLLWKESEETISKAKETYSSYVYWYNMKYKRYGPYHKSTIIDIDFGRDTVPDPLCLG